MAVDTASDDIKSSVRLNQNSWPKQTTKRTGYKSLKKHVNRSNNRTKEGISFNDPVCIVCLRRFSMECKSVECGNSSASPPEVERDFGASSGSSECSSSYSIYKRFLLLASRYLKLQVTTELLLKGNEQCRDTTDGGEATAFCKDCEILVISVCDSYAELQVKKLQFLWKLGTLEDKMVAGRQSVTVEVYRNSLQKLKLQLHTITGQRVHHFRQMFLVKCKAKREVARGPSPLVPRGLFPEHCKVGSAACRQMMTRLIVVFVLAATRNDINRRLDGVRDSRCKDLPIGNKPGPKRRKDSHSKASVIADLKEETEVSKLSGEEEEKVVKTEEEERMEETDFEDTTFNDDELHQDFSGDSDNGDRPMENTSLVWTVAKLDTDTTQDCQTIEPESPISQPKALRWNLRRKRARIAFVDATSSDTGSDYEPDYISDSAVTKTKSDIQPTAKNKRGYPRLGDCKPSVKCPKCHKLFLDKRSVSTHLIKVHDSRLTYSCPICGEKFIRWKDLRNHKREKHRKTSSTRRWLRTPKTTECPICNQVFHSELAFLKHRRDLHNKGPSRAGRPRKSLNQTTPDPVSKSPNQPTPDPVSKSSKQPTPDPVSKSPKKPTTDCNSKVPMKRIITKKIPKRSTVKSARFGRPAVKTTCNLCDRVFSTKQAYKLHYREEHVSKKSHKWPCKSCDKVLSTFTLLLQHRRSEHAKKDVKGQCNKCDQSFTSVEQLREHKKEAHKIIMSKHECPICFRTVCGEERFQWHLNAHETKKLRSACTLYCEVCGKHVYREDKLQEHMESVHNGLFTCSICKEDFSTGKLLRDHLVTHETTEKYFHCMMCFRGFSSQQFYDIHRKIAHRDARYVHCDYELCNETFENFELLNAHLKVHVEEAQTENDKERLEVHICDKCGKGHLNEYHLTIHKLTHTPHCVGKPGYDCPVGGCGQNVRYLPTLLTHYNRVHGKGILPMKCYTCGKGFSSREWFGTHKQICGEVPNANKNEHRFCQKCGETFPDQDALREHQISKHKYKRKLVRDWVDCPEEGCPRRFATANALNIHLVRVHKKGEKSFTCEKCGKSFVDQGNLNEHMITHGPPKFICDICGKMFKKPYDVREHRAAVHYEGERQKKWCCDLCGLSYYTKQGLKYHEWGMHADKSELPHECTYCKKKYGRKMLLTMHMKSCAKLHGVEIDEGPAKPRKKPGRKPKSQIDTEEKEVTGQNPSEKGEIEEKYGTFGGPQLFQQPLPGVSYPYQNFVGGQLSESKPYLRQELQPPHVEGLAISNEEFYQSSSSSQ